VYGGIQPKVKTALKALQDLYREGRIDPEFWIKDDVKVQTQIADGKIGLMYGGAMAILDRYETDNQLLNDQSVGAPTEAMVEMQSRGASKRNLHQYHSR
jgi:hypothetical protein